VPHDALALLREDAAGEEAAMPLDTRAASGLSDATVRGSGSGSAVVLGLSFFFHDSAAALVRDGQIVAAAAEERFCRRKHTNEFPKLAIEYCLEAANLR